MQLSHRVHHQSAHFPVFKNILEHVQTNLVDKWRALEQHLTVKIQKTVQEGLAAGLQPNPHTPTHGNSPTSQETPKALLGTGLRYQDYATATNFGSEGPSGDLKTPRFEPPSDSDVPVGGYYSSCAPATPSVVEFDPVHSSTPAPSCHVAFEQPHSQRTC